MAVQRVSVGGLTFDAVFKTDHTSKLTLTEHPVQAGADITDHAYMDPDEVSLEIGMSDAAVQSGKPGHSVSAYAALRALQEKREPVTVVTRLRTYKNMMIESISSPDDYTTMYGMRATIMLRQIIVAKTKTVRVSARNATTNGGTRQPVDVSAQPSVLKQAVGMLGL